MPETEGTSAPAPEVVDARLKNAKMNRRTSKAALTRAGKAVNHLIDAGRPREEVSQSLLLYKQTYDKLVVKHEEYASLIENDEAFTVEEHWLEECQETFMNLETKAKLYIESKVIEVINAQQSSINVEACTSDSVSNLEEKMDRETSMENSNGIPNLYETAPSNAINTSPVVEAPDPITSVKHTPASHANEQPEQSMNQTCSFKMEKPKMPKFSGDVREYAIFRADFKYAIEARYGKRGHY